MVSFQKAPFASSAVSTAAGVVSIACLFSLGIPAQSQTVKTILIQGTTDPNVGPSRKGNTFSGFARLQENAIQGCSGNNTTSCAVWTEWEITFRDSMNQPIFVFSSTAGEGGSPPILNANPQGLCFQSPLQSGTGIDSPSTLSTGAPGSTACGTGTTTVPNPAIGPSDSNNTGAPFYFNFYQYGEYTWTEGNNLQTSYHSWFRGVFSPQLDSNGELIAISADPANNGQNQLGWQARYWGTDITNALTAVMEGDTECNGSGGQEPIPGSNPSAPTSVICPYGYNQQRTSTLNNDVTARIQEIPAPLPLAGLLPLGATLKKMYRQRQNLLQRQV